MNYGFITGLPRSGSAWLANFLSYGNVMFLHDAWLKSSPGKIKEQFDQSGVYAAGVADPSNMLLLKDIDKEFPEAKWVVVTRPPKEVHAACEKINFPFVDFTKQLKELVNSREVLKVPFKQIFDRADDIGKFIYPEWECPQWRKDELKKLNVQVHFGKVSEQFRVPENIKDIDTVTPTKLEYFRMVKEIVGGDIHAVRFLETARDASELWRRLGNGQPIDTDKARELILTLGTDMLVNPFVKNFAPSVVPTIIGSFERHKNGEDSKHCPIDIDLLTTITYLFRGRDGVNKYMPKARQLSEKIQLEQPR